MTNIGNLYRIGLQTKLGNSISKHKALLFAGKFALHPSKKKVILSALFYNKSHKNNFVSICTFQSTLQHKLKYKMQESKKIRPMTKENIS